MGHSYRLMEAGNKRTKILHCGKGANKPNDGIPRTRSESSHPKQMGRMCATKRSSLASFYVRTLWERFFFLFSGKCSPESVQSQGSGERSSEAPIASALALPARE